MVGVVEMRYFEAMRRAYLDPFVPYKEAVRVVVWRVQIVEVHVVAGGRGREE